MKRIFAVILSVAVCFSMSPIALAGQEVATAVQNDLSTGDLLIYESMDGTFSTTGKSRSVSEAIRISPDDQFDSIYSAVSGNEYYQKIGDDQFIRVSKVEFSLTDYDAYVDIQKYAIPLEVLEGIASMSAWVKETNNENAQGVIFVSEANTNARSGELDTYPVTTTTWNGQTFHHYQVFFTDLWTAWQTVSEGGATTEAALNGFKEIAVFVAGAVSSQLGNAFSIFSLGQSCLESWGAITGQTPIYGNTNNKVMVDIQYNLYLKYTYWYDQGLEKDRLGCSSQRVLVKRVDTDTYLYTSTGGKRTSETVYPNEARATPNYYNPESTAFYNHVGGWVERAEYEAGNRRFLFAFPSFSWPSDWPSN